MMAGCVLLCSTFKGRRVHCKHERAANASLGSHSSQRRSDALRTSLLPSCVALAVMMAGCGLLCSTCKGRRMHCKHEGATHWTLRCNGTAPTSCFHKLVQHVISDFAACFWGGGEGSDHCHCVVSLLGWTAGIAGIGTVGDHRDRPGSAGIGRDRPGIKDA